MRGSLLQASLAGLALLSGGCASKVDWSKEPLPVTVSAANYTQLSSEEVYARVHEPASTIDVAPVPPAAPASPLFYAFVPGDVYASDTPLSKVYEELAVALAHRGYFNVVYEVKAGYLPKHVDYLLRIHCGVRRWKDPIVRTDKITWGNDGLLASWPSPYSMYRFGEDAVDDPRIGMDPKEAYRIAAYFQDTLKANQIVQAPFTTGTNRHDEESRDYCLVVVDAFKFEDVRVHGKRAVCAWSTFVAVPLHEGQEFSGLLRSMVRTATPYFGETTHGVQLYELPPGKVLMGEPVEVSGPPKAP